MPKVTKYWRQQNVGPRQDFTDFRQTLAVNISAHSAQKMVKAKSNPSLSNSTFSTLNLHLEAVVEILRNLRKLQ
jgi:hypothetical protein